MTAFAAMLTALHADANMGEDAYFRRPPYAWAAVRAIRSQPNDITGTIRAGTLHIDILTASIADTPAPGDEVKFAAAIVLGNVAHPAGTVFVVEDTDPDTLALSWRLTLADRN